MVAIEQTAFLRILAFIMGGLLLIAVGSLINTLLQPQYVHQESQCIYESGEEAVSHIWGKFNARFYGVAVIFLFFEIETILLFPCITVWTQRELNDATGGLWIYYTAISMTLFMSMLFIGLGYVWKQGHLASMQSPLSTYPATSSIPQIHYDQFNKRYATTVIKKKTL